jgi:two-component system, OmpR family, sensor kinase
VRSIRRRLLIWLSATVLAASAIGALGIYHRARTEANQVFDHHLKQIALSLRDQNFEQDELLGTLDEEKDYDFVIQVWSEDGVRRYYSHPHATLPQRATLGYDNVATEEGDWRAFSTQLRGLTIQVAQPMRVRQDLAARLALRTIAPLLLILPILGLLIWFIVGRGLRPLEQVAHAVGERNPASLDPLPDRDLPAEVRPVVAALNDLLHRLQRALATQREFIADAAHELRTPLTAVQLQIQLAERAHGETERAAAMTQLKDGVKRATHLVRQLLTLARQEPGVAARALSMVDLSQLAKEVLAEQAAHAQSKQIDLGLARDDAVQVLGDPEALRVMLGSLLDNAIRYTPSGGKVDMSLALTDGRASVLLADNGPGIPCEEREHVFDRFYRRAHDAAEGSGLGLAIVKTIALRHGAEISLEDRAGGGLQVRVTFPPFAFPPTP